MIELLIAGVLALVVLLAIGQIDVTRLYFGKQVRTAAITSSEADFAVLHMVKQFQQADRISRINFDNVQVRIPLGTNFDDPANYVWKQYKQTGTELWFYDNPSVSCTPTLKFKDVASVTVRYRDESPAPPGGEPTWTGGGTDSNVLEVTAYWTDPIAGSIPDVGEVTLRGGAYTNIDTGLQNPWLRGGSDISPPPAPCP